MLFDTTYKEFFKLLNTYKRNVLMSDIILVCLTLSDSLTNIEGSLPRAAVKITTDTKLMLPEAYIKEVWN